LLAAARPHDLPMIVVLNGPLGVGKSTLAEALSESIERCVMLDGDKIVATNPPSSLQYLHETLELLVAHHRRFGYRHFVIDHVWTSAEQLFDLRRRLATLDDDIRCFLLTLPLEENLRRIERRDGARAIDERDFNRRTFRQELEALADRTDLGEPFDVSAPPQELAAAMRRQLGLTQHPH